MYPNLTNSKQQLLDNIIADLKNIRNVVSVVLGGSYAQNMATDSSDLDIGIYYADNNPFDIKEIESTAMKYAKEPPTVTNFYQWGPYVNGGAWISTEQGKVDFLYRNIDQVTATIEKAKNGEWEDCYEQQPPYGFSSIFYLGEIEICIPLYDPSRIIQILKKAIQTYPSKLRSSVVSQSLWSSEFTIWHADVFSQKGDIYNLTGCLTRAVKYLTTALFAINELYPLGDKRAIERLEEADMIPNYLRRRIERILCVDKAHLERNIKEIKELHKDITKLAESYKAPYELSNRRG